MAFVKSLIVALTIQAASATLLEVDTTATGNTLSSKLHGLMFEDISNSIDGGLYSQQLRNPAFQGQVTVVDPWTVSYGAASISYDASNPLSSAITASIQVSVPSGSSGTTGIANPGYRGIIVDGTYYNSSFWLKGDYSGDVKIRLVGNETNIEYAWAYVTVASTADSWTQYNAQFWTTAAPDGNNNYVLEFDAALITQGSINIGYPVLYPPTFNGRLNGLRPDLANTLFDLQPKFLRFPGGNNLEGSSADNRWKWNETLGALETRPGRFGTWGYANTDGLGLMEYLQWCEDMSMTPVLAIWAGLGLDYGGAPILVGDDLEPYIDDSLNEIEFIIGDVSTPNGALRASLGHPEPYNLQFIEVGNEDNLSNGCDSYPQRFTQFFDAITAAYPQLTLIASTADSDCLPDPIPASAWLDFHDYNVPENYISQYSLFDTWSRTNKIMIGEYARWGATWSDVQGACSEAVFMMGWENNSDIIQMASYAPTLQNYDPAGGQWTPNLIPFVNEPNGIIQSVSYHVKKMFSTNHGDVVLPVTADIANNPIFWSANRKGSDTIIVKLANFASDTQSIQISIQGKSGMAATYTSISGAPDDSNTFDNPTLVTPTSSTVTGDDEGLFTVEVGSYGVAVLVV